MVCVPVKQTALALAVQGKHSEIANFLAFHGADLTIDYTRGEVGELKGTSSTISELCSKHGLLIGWTPAVHKILTSKAKLQVMSALLCFSRQQGPLPQPLVEMILRAAISIPN